ncbi:MAG: recombination mediator RecR [bacterium]|nr:recombination mediator RecR [bacterium]
MDSIKRLTALFSKFPTIGQRTAGRFVYYLLKLPKERVDELAVAILELKKNVKFCGFCFNPFDTAQGRPASELCDICQNSSRNKQLLCLVEKEADLLSIEQTKKYNGLYFILGGATTFTKSDIENLRLRELQERIKTGAFLEIIIATNPTLEGKAISVLIQRALKELPQFPTLKITRLGQGLPVGGELEYTDDETLESAFEGRK